MEAAGWPSRGRAAGQAVTGCRSTRWWRPGRCVTSVTRRARCAGMALCQSPRAGASTGCRRPGYAGPPGKMEQNSQS